MRIRMYEEHQPRTIAEQIQEWEQIEAQARAKLTLLRQVQARFPDVVQPYPSDKFRSLLAHEVAANIDPGNLHNAAYAFDVLYTVAHTSAGDVRIYSARPVNPEWAFARVNEGMTILDALRNSVPYAEAEHAKDQQKLVNVGKDLTRS